MHEVWSGIRPYFLELLAYSIILCQTVEALVLTHVVPKITIHQEIWLKLRLFLIDSLVLFAALLITVCLYKVEYTVISYILDINISLILYLLINAYNLLVAYHFVSFIGKFLKIAIQEPSGD
jgi:hypothetical protein